METYKTLIETAFKNAENNISKITDDIINMEGMTGTKTRHFYNNLLNTEDARYLEIGSWKGSSVCSAMYGNKANVVCIDNWSEFGGPKKEFLENFEKFKGENNATFIENDCYQVNVSKLPKFNIYMYDGNHSSENHYNALLHYFDCLDDVFIFIVDDWNWENVRDETFKSIKNINLKILYEKEVRLTWDNSVTPEPGLSKNWWNGIYVCVLQKTTKPQKTTKLQPTLKINYKNNSSELCEIGKKYDTDKSSQRNNVTNYRHCHPYTLFYEGLFKNKKNDNLKLAELGILDGASLLMWKDYFTNAEIYGFEYDNNLINNFTTKFNNERITLANVDVSRADSIIKTFGEINTMYDIIIEDTTHQFEDQIRVIENIYQYLKPGGVLIIEDIFKKYNEYDYLVRLKPILEHFQDYYFVELDHNNRNSTGWDNDKLFVLIKSGDQPIFKNNNKLTLITPSYRVNNLLEIKKSINFKYIEEWIIVYDGSKIPDNPNLFENQEDNKIKEYVHTSNGISGNPQRNYALTKITNSNALIYYLDDDNILHPNIYRLMNIIDNSKMYTFNQRNRLRGCDRSDAPATGSIDTAMTIIPFDSCKNEKWVLDAYAADGMYIRDCYNNNKNTNIFVNNDLCYYNKLST